MVFLKPTSHLCPKCKNFTNLKLFNFTPKITIRDFTDMSKQIFEEQKHKDLDFTMSAFEVAEYENCDFINCNFSNINLSHITFLDCRFEGCNMTMVKVGSTAFKNISFTNCKMLGVHFSDCNPFLLEMKFESCILQLTSFYNLKLKGTIFKNCELQEADFSDCDLTSSAFADCDLALTVFDRTILEKVDFRTATNFNIDLEKNRIKKAQFSVHGLAGLLTKYDIKITQ